MPNLLKSLISADGSGSAKLVYRILAENAPAHWKGFVAAILMMGVAAACTAGSAYLVGHVVNTVYDDRNFLGVVALSLATVVLFTVKGLATYGQAVTLGRVSNRITAANQRRIFDKLVQEGVGYFADRHSSEFTASALYGATATTIVLNLVVLALGRDLLSLIALVGVMVTQDPVMSLVGLVVAPPAIFGVRKLIKRVRAIASTQFKGGAAILQTMQETVQGFRVIKAFNLEDKMRQRIFHDIANVEQANNKMARAYNRSAPLMESLGGIAIGLTFLYSGYRVLETGASPGGFVSFITAFFLAYEPAKRIARLNIDLSNSLVGVRVLFDLLDSPPSEGDDSGKPALRVDGGRIELSEVDFSYRSSTPVLRKMSFVAEPTRITALVGPSGGGKSTIFNLLLRFYDADGGTIAIDGQDIQSVSRKSLRGKLAYVGQDVFLFRGTIRENILCGKSDASEEELVAAAKAAFAHEFITGFPAGYDSQVGEFGLQLSLGQRQRVAVARALIKDAPLILLDEATASLDSESEHKVQEAILHLCTGRTTLVIAHRLNTIKHADRIHVVENGTIVESGRHDILLRKNGRYTTFFRLQFPNQADERHDAPLETTLT